MLNCPLGVEPLCYVKLSNCPLGVEGGMGRNLSDPRSKFSFCAFVMNSKILSYLCVKSQYTKSILASAVDQI